MLRLHGMMFLLLSIRSHAAIPAEDTVFFDADTEDITAEDEDGVNRTEIYPETTPSSQGDTVSQLHFSTVVDDGTTKTAGFLQEVKDVDSSTQSAATDSGTTAEDVQSTERPTSSTDTDTTPEVTITDPITATSTSSPADDFYKKISEIAVKRKLLMERGYEKYKSIVFKSGRNLVPSWLFFGDAPDVRSSESNTTSVTEGPNVEINNSNSDHGSFPSNETDGEVTHRVNVREESSVEENGSGLTPLTITESTTQAMDELPFSSSFSFSNPLNHSDGIPSEDSDATKPSPSPTTMFPESSTTETENSSTMLLSTTTQATTQAATQTTTAQTSDETTQAAVQENSEESTTAGTTSTAISEISVENSTTVTVPTHSSSTTVPTTTLEQISTSVEPINSSHAPEILPPLLSIPPLSDLSSFSSLNTPLDETSRPPTPVEENSERRGVEKKKSFGVIGYRNSIRLRKLQKKFINSGKTLTHFNVAESDGRRVFRLWRNAPVSHVEKHRFVMRRARQSQKNSTHPWKRNEIYTANRRVLIVPSEKAELLTKCLHSSQKSLKHGIRKDGHPKQNGISTKIQENSRKRRSTRKLRYGYVPAKQKLLQFFIHFRPT